jgi:hypothetical protein
MSTPTNRERAAKLLEALLGLHFSDVSVAEETRERLNIVEASFDAVEQAASLYAAQNAWWEGYRIGYQQAGEKILDGVEAKGEDTRKDQPNVPEPELQAVTTPAAVSNERPAFKEKIDAAIAAWALSTENAGALTCGDVRRLRDCILAVPITVDEERKIEGYLVGVRCNEGLLTISTAPLGPHFEFSDCITILERPQKNAKQWSGQTLSESPTVQREEETPKCNPSVQQALDVLAWRESEDCMFMAEDGHKFPTATHSVYSHFATFPDEITLALPEERAKGYGIRVGQYLCATDPDKLAALIKELEK